MPAEKALAETIAEGRRLEKMYRKGPTLWGTDAQFREDVMKILPALLDVAEAGDALLGYHDRCGVASGYGDALRSALSRLRGVRS